jgi:outer membrane protein OmpA-like peptidoglycan-associated protein
MIIRSSGKGAFMIRATRSFSLAALPILGLACATVDPPKELVEARAEFERASVGPTAKVNPAGLYEAKKSLTKANAAFEQDPKSDDTRDVAYIALRKIQLANAHARTELASQEKARADRERARIENEQQRTKQKLTEAELAEIRRKLTESEDQRRSEADKLARYNEQLQNTSAQLQAERQARLDAEKKAEEAVANLAKIAAVKQETRGLVITLSGGVLFASTHATLLSNARPKLDEIALALQKAEADKFVVEGHTDARGSESTNQDLSYRRAQTVRDYLVDRGVPSEKIRAVGYGRSRPVADNSTSEGRANNRRVEIVVQPKGPPS